MYRWVERRRTGRAGQGGFTLIEVVVAVGLLVLVLVALLPELVVGIRATSGAKNLTQAKGVLQARLEVMRSMPYHVAPVLGDNYVDLLDTYYENLKAPTATLPGSGCQPSAVWVNPDEGWSGYVPVGGPRCSYEPPSGAFYRKVSKDITAAGLGTFRLVVDTAFLSSATPPQLLVPRTGYNSHPLIVGESDMPASGQVGVWATIVYRSSSALKPASTYTQVTERNPGDSSLEVAATVNTIRVSSQLDDRPTDALVPGPFTTITLDAGVVAQSGARFTGSNVSMNANAVSASSGTGALLEGAKAALSAPASAVQAYTFNAASWLNSNCQFACIGPSTVEGASVSATNGLPLSAGPVTPVRVSLTSVVLKTGHSSLKAKHGGMGKYGGFGFNNGPDQAGAGHARGLLNDQPMVTLDGWEPGASNKQSNCVSSGTTESSNFVSASGFLYSDALTAPTPAVRSCVTARSAAVMLFPTSWAPDGVIRVVLDQSSLQCQVIRNAALVRSATATATFSATVQYWNESTSSYVTVGPSGGPTVTQSSGTDPLANVDLNTSLGHGALKLSDFIKSWRASTSSDVEVDVNADGTSVQAKVPGVVTINSQPTREGDLNSVVSLTMGTFTCAAKDVR